MAPSRPTAASLRAAFIAASTAWAILIVAVPFVASHAHASALAGALIAGVYGIGALVCHQLPERSIHLWSVQMPVCARCAGIYFGAVAGALARAFRTAKTVRRERTAPVPVAHGLRRAWPARILLAVAAAPTALTLAYEWTTGDMPSHAIRAAAGACIGAAVAWLVVAAADNQVN